jgi:hypothetical protein
MFKYGIGLIKKDADQMPGVFFLKERRIVRAFRHPTIADEPDYLKLVGARQAQRPSGVKVTLSSLLMPNRRTWIGIGPQTSALRTTCARKSVAVPMGVYEDSTHLLSLAKSR